MIIGLIAIAVFALAAIAIWQVSAKSQQPKMIPNERMPEVGDAAVCKPVSFTSDGSKIEGWLLEPAAAGSTPDGTRRDDCPIVVIAHGWGSNRTKVLRYAAPLLEAGYRVWMYDARSHGDSERIKAPSALMFRDDVLAAVEEVRKLPGAEAGRIAVLGHSMGGFGTLLALDKGLRVGAVVTDSMPVRFETMLRAELNRKKLPLFPLAYLIPPIWLIRAGITTEEYRKADIPAILSGNAGPADEGKQPVLMIHSERDDFIPAEDLHGLERQLPKGLVPTVYVHTEGHSSSETEPAFWGAVLPYLKATIGKGTVRG
ncbi:alpha/beta hydrolase [Paenibacillus sp. GCM10027627]|uniref:alpha/beta hydrolase n=1 Tax=unclassified Paenibacillus TaxID=185978 RepID=UPI003631D3F0